MKAYLWFILAVLILLVAYGYVAWRLLLPSRLKPPWNAIAWFMLFLFLLLPPITITLEVNRFENAWTDGLAWLSYLSLGFFSLLFTFLVLRDVLWLVISAAQKILALFQERTSRGSLDQERREFLSEVVNLGVIGVAGVATGYGIYEARRQPATVEMDIPIANLPVDLEGFRIVQITDIHAGLTVKRPFVERVVRQVSELAPDLIAFTGDLADGSVPYLREHVAPLAELSAPFGRFFITGNHEYYSGAEPWIEEASRLGFTVLLNEHRLIRRGSARLLLAGVTDYTAGQFVPRHASSPAASVSHAPASDVRILLAHQPRTLYDALAFQFDLQISGHTHGGQFFPWNLLAAVGQPYISGLHKHENTWIYVSRGTGYWGPPVRLASRSEVTILKLKRAAA